MSTTAAAGPPQVRASEHLSDQDATSVTTLVRAAQDADRVAPLSENAVLLLHESRPGVRHLLTYTGDGPSGQAAPGGPGEQAARTLAGYAVVESFGNDQPVTGELVVHPAFRRRGHGRALLAAIQDAAQTLSVQPDDHPADHPVTAAGTATTTVRVWAHGNLPQARRFAAAHRFVSVRELWQMSRTLVGDLPQTPMPDGFEVRDYRPGDDDEAWLRVNSAAFAHHPEQGSWTQRDLDLRLAEPWFDAAGFLVLQDTSGGLPMPMAGYHWTKVHPASEDADGTDGTGPIGEIYVVGIDPAYQGRGLSGPLVGAGLAHLRRRGLSRVMLYVDADNEPAVRVYRRLGFSTSAVDVMFAARSAAQ